MARNFPDWIKAYMHYTRASESPDQFHLWTAISVVAGALRRRVWNNQNAYQYTPNMYIVLVGPPGVANKSTSMRAGENLLAEVKGVKLGPPAVTWQKMAVSLQEAQEDLKLFDTNGKEVVHKMACLNFFVSELGTFFRLNEPGFIEALTDWFDGQSSNRDWTYDTRTQGTVTVRNPWVNLLGCTTPAWLEANFPKHMIGGGLTSRIIFVYGDKKRQLIAYPSREIQPEDHVETHQKLLADLRIIATMGGEYKITEAAMDWGSNWYEELWRKRPAYMASERYDGYRARKQTHLHKIAMVIAASQSSQLLIQTEHLQTADALLSYVEPDMVKVFESIGAVDEMRHVNEVFAFVSAYDGITPENLWRLCRNNMNSKDFDGILKLMNQNKLIQVVMREGKQVLMAVKQAPS